MLQNCMARPQNPFKSLIINDLHKTAPYREFPPRMELSLASLEAFGYIVERLFFDFRSSRIRGHKETGPRPIIEA